MGALHPLALRRASSLAECMAATAAAYDAAAELKTAALAAQPYTSATSTNGYRYGSYRCSSSMSASGAINHGSGPDHGLGYCSGSGSDVRGGGGVSSRVMMNAFASPIGSPALAFSGGTPYGMPPQHSLVSRGCADELLDASWGGLTPVLQSHSQAKSQSYLQSQSHLQSQSQSYFVASQAHLPLADLPSAAFWSCDLDGDASMSVCGTTGGAQARLKLSEVSQSSELYSSAASSPFHAAANTCTTAFSDAAVRATWRSKAYGMTSTSSDASVGVGANTVTGAATATASWSPSGGGSWLTDGTCLTAAALGSHSAITLAAATQPSAYTTYSPQHPVPHSTRTRAARGRAVPPPPVSGVKRGRESPEVLSLDGKLRAILRTKRMNFSLQQICKLPEVAVAKKVGVAKARTPKAATIRTVGSSSKSAVNDFSYGFDCVPGTTHAETTFAEPVPALEAVTAKQVPIVPILSAARPLNLKASVSGLAPTTSSSTVGSGSVRVLSKHNPFIRIPMRTSAQKQAPSASSGNHLAAGLI